MTRGAAGARLAPALLLLAAAVAGTAALTGCGGPDEGARTRRPAGDDHGHVPRRHRPERGRRPLHRRVAGAARRRPPRVRAHAARRGDRGGVRPLHPQRRRPRGDARGHAAHRRVGHDVRGRLRGHHAPRRRSRASRCTAEAREARPTPTSGWTRRSSSPTSRTSATRSSPPTRRARPSTRPTPRPTSRKLEELDAWIESRGRHPARGGPPAGHEPREPRLLRRQVRLPHRRHRHPQRRHRRVPDGQAARRRSRRPSAPRACAPSSWSSRRTRSSPTRSPPRPASSWSTDLRDHSLSEPDGEAATYIDMMKYDTRLIVEALK